MLTIGFNPGTLVTQVNFGGKFMQNYIISNKNI